MQTFKLKELCTRDIISELERIGFDDSYKNVACNKFQYKNIKIYSLTLPQANILKQIALSVGADCAVHKNIITAEIDKTDVILGGSISQLTKISDKLKQQPFSLKILSQNIVNLLNNQNKTTTKLIGILNVTPNSFSDGGKYLNPDLAIKHISEMLEEGADGIDIGAESTRPNAICISAEEQINRLKPIFERLKKENFNVPISLDTRNSQVAEFALDYGVSIINDVSGFEHDENLINIVAKYNAGIIIQHSKPVSNDVIGDIYFELNKKIEYAKSFGINNIIIDPGIGFGKDKTENFEILNRIEELYSLNYPLMVGISRKSLLGITTDDNLVKDVLSTAVAYPLMQKRVDYLRVHNIKFHKQLLKLI